MLAGLLFAIAEADDQPDQLVATLPFGGATLIEFQARLLIAAGVTQIAVVVARLTPELVGAINRIGRRGVAVDTVRSAAETVAKLHPLARVLVFGDGLVSSDVIVGPFASEGGDALLVTTDAQALPGLERVGRDAIWAGIARVQPARLAEVVDLPSDYDFQSTLLRVTAQAGAEHLSLPTGQAREGHGIERQSSRLRLRNEAVLLSHVSNRVAWADRYLIAPGARLLLPWLVARAVPVGAVALGSGAVMLAGLLLIALHWAVLGLALTLLAMVGFATGEALAWVRDETALAKVQQGLIGGAAGFGAVILGAASGVGGQLSAGVVAALALVGLGGLAERAANDRIRRGWWASAAACPVVLLPFVAASAPLVGLLVAAGYAGVTLGAAIETLREKP